MEWPWKQFERWPRKMSPDELNEALEEAGKRGEREGEDLVSKEETTKALEGEGAKQAERIFSPEETGRKAGEFVKKLEERGERGKDKKKK